MTIFLRVQGASDLACQLLRSCIDVRSCRANNDIFVLDDSVFSEIPGSPFAYWSSSSLRSNYVSRDAFEHGQRFARVGLQTSDDFRFVRLWWESSEKEGKGRWFPFVRGGKASKFSGSLALTVNWKNDGEELKAWASTVNRGMHWSRNIRSPEHYMKPGVTWPLRAAQLSPYPMPSGCIFSTRGTVAFDESGALEDLMGLMGSAAFDYLFKLLLGRFGHPEFSIGAVQRVPVPSYHGSGLGDLARRAWALKRTLDTTEETSHAFSLPAALRSRLGDYDPPAIETELSRIQAEIDAIAFDLYGFSKADRVAVHASQGAPSEGDSEAGDDQDDEASDDEDSAAPIDHTAGLLSWALGVAFGRFDWRLATGERAAPTEPEPFDPLPTKSPGMLPDGAEPFHAHEGILVDDPGHPNDLARLIEEVLARVEAPVPEDVRRWLQKDFFPFHLQRYSKSRRKAPIYWPLSTTSGSYTLWVYYPSLTSQTLYTAINDFVEPKLKQVGADVTALRNKGSARTRDDEKQFEALQAFELELIELRDTLLKLAPSYKPNHDDGVQISAAPLWTLKLEKGDYDWAMLAMNYWPERVREKCKTDKSLAIAHGLEHLYIEPEAAPMKTRKKKGEA
ncbi:type II restriction endonuclease subunit M [Gammaproteobacteria bacterium PRO6]|nr:type II restriction endonuclease subunit M [Gammaproteobacteria bacterium PRO6]